ncbi:MAG: hypothetical protein VX494_14720 [Actinomycetota bacterium]|nr:hypothetical protein [Actinomycetota bacterium]
MTKQNVKVTTPAEEVERQRSVLAQWEAEAATARAELESLQSRAGEEVLDDAAAASRLPALMGQLSARMDIAQRAIEAQRPRVAAAESAYLLAEAEKLRGPVKRAENALARHRERTAELLRLLEEHEGPFVPKALLDFEENKSSAGPHEYVLARSEVMENDLAALRRPVLVLEELAAGRDPMLNPELSGGLWLGQPDPAEVFPPAVWGPDAVVPAPAYLRAVHAARERVEQIDREAEACQRLIEAADARRAELGEAARVTGEAKARQKLSSLEERRADAEAALESLVAATVQTEQVDA